MKITKHKKIWFVIVATVFVIGILSMIIRGFNLDTDFSGGTTFQYDLHQPLDKDELDKVKALVDKIEGITISSVQKAGDNDSYIVMKSGDVVSSELRGEVFDLLVENYGITEDDILMVSSISPSISNELKTSAIIATVVAVVLMLVYITVRFEFRSGIAAVLCLMHDIFIVVSFYSLFQIPVGSTIIAVLLTILGYSINATIIIFDRIRENVKTAEKGSNFSELVDRGINKSIKRSINTSVTTLLTIGMIYLFGVDSIKDFALPIMVGIIAGFFSSVFLAGSIWDLLKGKNKRI